MRHCHGTRLPRGSAFIGLALAVGTLSGCDRSGLDLLPQPSVDLPSVVEIGDIQVLDPTEYGEFLDLTHPYAGYDGLGVSQTDPWGWCKTPGLNGEDYRCYYGQIGATDGVNSGGATFTFKGTDGPVCVMVDPETVFWGPSIEPTDIDLEYTYPDSYIDDGDLDLYGGLSSYYTGSPGIEIGDFTGYYTDSLGREIEIEYGACFQYGFYSVIDYAHAGRATPEYCTIDTSQRLGVEYTVVLDTFSVPLDDGALSFGVVVVEGDCSLYTPNECTIAGESLVADADGGTELRSCTDRLESAFCAKDMLNFCCANPEMCGDLPDFGTCDPFYSEWGSRDAYCLDNGPRCCDGALP